MYADYGVFKSLAPGISLRIRYVTEQNAVEQFTVQLEIYMDHSWYAVVRYDNAHGEAHIDYLDLKSKGLAEHTLAFQ